MSKTKKLLIGAVVIGVVLITAALWTALLRSGAVTYTDESVEVVLIPPSR